MREPGNYVKFDLHIIQVRGIASELIFNILEYQIQLYILYIIYKKFHSTGFILLAYNILSVIY